MPHVVTQACCSDASCVYACPVNCIHPTPDEPDFHSAEMLFIDPKSCVDCGACVAACPVDAIVPSHRANDDQKPFIEINKLLSAERNAKGFPRNHMARVEPLTPLTNTKRRIHVAVVGSGPAAMYATDELLRYPQISVTVFERLTQPFGLARFGVAPDHQHTRQVARLFEVIAEDPRCTMRLGVEIGRDIMMEDLRRDFDAVIVGVGASSDRKLGIAGEDGPRVTSATDFVAWYNGHPDHVNDDYDLSGARVAIVGNGNVALDSARILAKSPDSLAVTNISRRALATLRSSGVRDIVLLGRRGPAQSAFTLPEMIGLRESGIPVRRVTDEAVTTELSLSAPDELTRAKLEVLRGIPEVGANDIPDGPGTSITLRYLHSPTSLEQVGDKVHMALNRNLLDDATGRIVSSTPTEPLDADLVLTAVGYHGRPVQGLPFDAIEGRVPNEQGRVEPGVYVTGWIKRGPTGFIGTNRTCAQESVEAFRADLEAGLLPERSGVLSSHGNNKRRFALR